MRLYVFLLTAGIVALMAAASADAAVYTVTGTVDPGTCDAFTCTGFQAALNAAKAAKGPDEVDLKKASYAAGKGITMSDADGVTVVGVSAQATVIRGATGIRTIANTGVATLEHLKVTAGSLPGGNGGGVLNSGTLTLDHVEVSGNTAANGAGIWSQGALTVIYSLIASNTATGFGGGLAIVGAAGAGGATLAMRDSTVAFNTAQVRSGGGGIDMRGNPANSGMLQRSTVADNTGGNPDIGTGGILLAGDGEVLGARAMILAGNKNVTGAASNCLTPSPRDDGFNFESGTDCGFKSASDRQNADPGFPTGLMDGGGETDVLPIPSASPAVDLAPACTGVTDQRDLARPQGKGCDAGAYEFDQPPDTTITGGPSGLVRSTNATFTFTSTDPGSTFQCSLDGGAAATCSPPQTYNGLAQGAHTFTVRATDPAGNVDSTAAAASWTVDTVAPDTTITGSPPTRVNGAISFSFSSNDASATFQCRLDTPAGSGNYGACTSPRAYSGLAEGNYRFHVVATDPAGNTDPTDATWDFQVSVTPPNTTLTPIASPTNNNTPTFAFTSSEAGSTFECKVDNGSYGTCSSPFTTPVLSDGSHTFSVRANDAGNTDQTPATQTFVVDTTPPAADVTGGPAGVTTDAAPAFSFASPDDSVQFLCRLAGPGGAGTEQACTSPHGFGTLAPGSYTFFVTAVDPAGNRTTTSRSFTVAVVQQQTPMPTPQPVFHQTVVVQPAGGKVLVRRKGSKTFVALDVTQGIPLGSEVDAKHGKVRLTSVPKPSGKAQTALFYGGIFVVTQTGGITQLALSERLARCTSAKAAAAAAKKKKPKTRSLWGDGHGSFRTKGQYSAATVRGTRWNVRDTCAGTLTRVARGVIAVQDFVKHKTKVLRAGQRYLAKPKRRP